jgi:hypothetical protein
VRSIAAGEAEALVLAQMQGIFKAPEIAAQVIAAAARLDDDASDIAGREREIVGALGSLDTIWAELSPAEQQRILHLLIERIAVKPSRFSTTLRAEGIRSLVTELHADDAPLKADMGVAACLPFSALSRDCFRYQDHPARDSPPRMSRSCRDLRCGTLKTCAHCVRRLL